MLSFIATITSLMIPLLLKISLVLCDVGEGMGFFAMIKTMISTTVETYTYTTLYKPFVGGCKVVVEIISIMKNMLDFENSRFRQRKTIR